MQAEHTGVEELLAEAAFPSPGSSQAIADLGPVSLQEASA